jgi:hypothetical protein
MMHVLPSKGQTCARQCGQSVTAVEKQSTGLWVATAMPPSGPDSTHAFRDSPPAGLRNSPALLKNSAVATILVRYRATIIAEL